MFRLHSCPCLWALSIAALFSSSGNAQTLPGYETDTLPVPAGAVFVGGLEVLPGGNYAVYDGSSVIEMSAKDGSKVQTLFTPVGMPFGAFLVLDPTGQFLYFGESSNGEIIEIDRGSGATRVVTTALYPFDLAFDRSGRCFLSWAPVIGGGSRVSLLDLGTGSLDDVVSTAAPSGPLLFTDAGDLYMCTPDFNWPPPVGSTEVLYYSKTQVDSAVGAAVLAAADGALVASVDGAYGFAMDESGDLFVTDGYYHKITEIDAETGTQRKLWDSFDLMGLTYARYVPASVGAFEWFQPQGSGELVVLDTDYFSFSDVRRVRPARPALSTTPASPIPAGSYQFDLAGGVPGGVVLMFVTGGVAGSEVALNNRQWPAPLLLGLDFSAGLYLSQVLALDGNGEFNDGGVNPGHAGLTLGVQGFVGESASGPFYGTTQPLPIIFQ